MSGGRDSQKGEWQQARRNVFRGLASQWDIFRSRKFQEGEALCSIFVSDFPDRCKARDLFGLFGCIGEVVEVVVSPRRNRLGRRFGFARFGEVVDARLLAVKLDNVMIEGKKIHANVPRFERKSFVIGKHREDRAEGWRRNDVSREAARDRGAWKVFDGGKGYRSFTDVVTNKPFVEAQREFAVLKFSPKEESLLRLSKAFVGTLRCPGSAHNIQSSIERAGFFAIRISPMGASRCLLEEEEEGVLKEFLEDGENWWSEWFSAVSKWNLEEIDPYCAVWLNVRGIPLAAWCSDFFTDLASLFGEFISVDESTANGRCLDVARIQVKVELAQKIPEKLEVDIGGKVFGLFIGREQRQVFRQHEGNSPKGGAASFSSEYIESEDLWSNNGSAGSENSLVSSARLFQDVGLNDSARGRVDESAVPDGGCEVLAKGVDDAVLVPDSVLVPVASDAIRELNVPVLVQSGAVVDSLNKFEGSFDKAVLAIKEGSFATDSVSSLGPAGNALMIDRVIEEKVRGEVPLRGEIHKKVKFKKLMEVGSSFNRMQNRHLFLKGKKRKALFSKRKKGGSGEGSREVTGAVLGVVPGAGGGVEAVSDELSMNGFSSENEIISRNNFKQWHQVDNRGEVRLKGAVEALGVSKLKGAMFSDLVGGESTVDCGSRMVVSALSSGSK